MLVLEKVDKQAVIIIHTGVRITNTFNVLYFCTNKEQRITGRKLIPGRGQFQ